MLAIKTLQQRLVRKLTKDKGKIYAWGDAEFNKDFTPSTKDIMTPYEVYFKISENVHKRTFKLETMMNQYNYERGEDPVKDIEHISFG